MEGRSTLDFPEVLSGGVSDFLNSGLLETGALSGILKCAFPDIMVGAVSEVLTGT